MKSTTLTITTTTNYARTQPEAQWPVSTKLCSACRTYRQTDQSPTAATDGPKFILFMSRRNIVPRRPPQQQIPPQVGPPYREPEHSSVRLVLPSSVASPPPNLEKGYYRGQGKEFYASVTEWRFAARDMSARCRLILNQGGYGYRKIPSYDLGHSSMEVGSVVM